MRRVQGGVQEALRSQDTHEGAHGGETISGQKNEIICSLECLTVNHRHDMIPTYIINQAC